MKVLETTAGALRAACSTASKIVEKRNTVPILGAVKLENGRLIATDLDSEIRVSLPGAMEGESAFELSSIAKLAAQLEASESVSINSDSVKAQFGFNGSEYSVPAYPPHDFPEFRKTPQDSKETATGNMGIFAALRRVSFAISTEETRYYLNGAAILPGKAGGDMVAAATDGHRVAFMPIPHIDGAAKKIIPRKILAFLCAQKGEPERLRFSEGLPQFEADYAGMSVSAKTIDGTYPDVFRVIPGDEAAFHFSCDRALLLKTLTRMAAFSGGQSKAVRIEAAGARLRLTMKTNNGGEAREDIAAGYTAINTEVGFNIHYLADLLKAFRGDAIDFAANPENAASNPWKVTATSDDLLVVLMPMRI